MKDDNSLIEFPCDFQIKIIGKHHESFVLEIGAIARRHFPGLNDNAIRTKVSTQNKYLAITLTVRAENKATLDALYQELTKHPDISMVL